MRRRCGAREWGVFGSRMGAGLRQVVPGRFASHGGELIGHIFVPGPVITYDRSQPVTKAGFGPGQRRGG